MRRRLLPDLSTLQTFECAARHGNFSRAAEELNLTQSAVSRQIKELEAQTGQQLFERIRQRVVLSEAGAQALPDYEMLELVLFRAIPRQDVKPLARLLLDTFGDFNRVVTASPVNVPELSALELAEPELLEPELESLDVELDVAEGVTVDAASISLTTDTAATVSTTASNLLVFVATESVSSTSRVEIGAGAGALREELRKRVPSPGACVGHPRCHPCLAFPAPNFRSTAISSGRYP